MIVIVAGDAGPAKYLSCLRSYLPPNTIWVGNDLTKPIFAMNGIDCSTNLKLLSNIELVVTGTQLGEGLDKELMMLGKSNGISTVSVIDHWSWYRRRFELPDCLLLPDWIIVNDVIALEDAIADGIPENRLIIGGNPVLGALAEHVFTTVRTPASHFVEKSQDSSRTVVFISEEIFSVFGGTSDDLGYDEFKVVHQILEVLAPADRLIIKLHPAESPNKYDYLQQPRVSVIGQMNIHELSALADVVIGMASILLLELAMIRTNVISFRPDARMPFIGERLNATVGADSKKTLKRLLTKPHKASDAFRKQVIGSGQRIANIFKELV